MSPPPQRASIKMVDTLIIHTNCSLHLPFQKLPRNFSGRREKMQHPHPVARLGCKPLFIVLCACVQVAEGEAKDKELAEARAEKEKAIALMQQEQLNAFKVWKPPLVACFGKE